MYLLIDYREQDFVKRLSEFIYIENDKILTFDFQNTEIKFKVTSLPIGDFCLIENLDDISTVLLMIERKSMKDLSSSITDGRFREQKARLSESIQDSNKICYLIEGSKQLLERDNFMLSNTIINGSLLNLSFRHKYHVIQSENKQDTFNMVMLLYKKFKNQEFEQNMNAVDSVKLLKRSDKLVANKLVHQLCLIPGVSQRVANVIIAYPFININDLINKYNTLEKDSDKELLLSEIIVSETNGKTRRIGKALSKKIYEYLCC
jgi:ERCC4-type nuclease